MFDRRLVMRHVPHSQSPQKNFALIRKTLKGFWKLRVGDYRVVFKVVKNDVWILGIIHRRDVYGKVEKRV